ncbi:MAG: aldehyde dehydrogenase family protein [Verrucomicrobiota bacterium]|nr:aldehyde dehydrogenase family protein [Verrucomicrobiota bacterium]
MSDIKTYKNYINGEWVAPSSDKYYENFNPADDTTVLGRFPLSEEADVNRAVESSHQAFRGWSKMLHGERAKYIHAFMVLLEKNKQRIAEVLCQEQGKTLKEAMGEPVRSLAECDYVLGEGHRMEGITMPSDRKAVTSVAVRVPLGVVAAITPWNFPFLTPLRKVIPALVAGNTVVLKPAFDTPRCGILIAELLHEAGFPAGVVNTVIGKGSVMGDALSGHPLVRGITFTGSTSIGRRINEIASRSFTKVQLEMGGKNPAIVADYKDLDYAASQITSAAFSVTGQRCTSISRIIVLREHAEELEALIADKMKSYVVGNGMDSKVTMGPVVNRPAGEGIMSHIQSARDEGATIKAGGNQFTGGDYDKGFYIEPTFITDVTPSMKVAIDEIFGPVLVSIKVDSFEEAIAVANDSEYGLAASIFTDNLEYIYAFQNEVDTGMAHINHGTVTDGYMPFGGVKGSGLGQFSKGKTNKDFFTALKVIYTKYAK